MGDALPQIGLVVVLVILNALFAGTEMALVSLRDGQIRRLEGTSRAGATLAALARDPNRFLATIQIGITLAGFLASAAAAVSLAEPLLEPLSFLGGAAEPAAILLVTIVLAYLTLVFGELAPKRIAMQRAERWSLLAARPLSALSTLARPAVWLLSRSTDVAVRILGGQPGQAREEITEDEVRDLVATQEQFTDHQRRIIDGAFEIAERPVEAVLRPRPDVFVIDAAMAVEDALLMLAASGYSRAPVSTNGHLDETVGVVHLRDLLGAHGGLVGTIAQEVMVLPESVRVLDALHQMQANHAQFAVVIDEHGAAPGIVTMEDLMEELVGEIYDESDREVLAVESDADGVLRMPGRFPIHDLVDVGIDGVPTGKYSTIAGFLLAELGRIPEEPGDVVSTPGWTFEVLAVENRAIVGVEARRTEEQEDAPDTRSAPEDRPNS